jgi:hypothetical protein
VGRSRDSYYAPGREKLSPFLHGPSGLRNTRACTSYDGGRRAAEKREKLGSVSTAIYAGSPSWALSRARYATLTSPREFLRGDRLDDSLRSLVLPQLPSYPNGSVRARDVNVIFAVHGGIERRPVRRVFSPPLRTIEGRLNAHFPVARLHDFFPFERKLA